jgi:hypothetical protein
MDKKTKFEESKSYDVLTTIGGWILLIILTMGMITGAFL